MSTLADALRCGHDRSAAGDLEGAAAAFAATAAAFPRSPTAALHHGLALRLAGCPLDEVEAALRRAAALGGGRGAGARGRAAGLEASQALALLLLQQHQQGPPDGPSSRSAEAAALCAALGCRYRLAALAHSPLPPPAPCAVAAAIDGALPPSLVAFMAFCLRPEGPFWREHRYHDPSTGYFSYAMSLDRLRSPDAMADLGGFGCGLRALAGAAAQLRPARLGGGCGGGGATHVEWWAHCRRHASGHQLHFDSDAEGCGPVGPRHPLASAVLALGSTGVGGPTLVTAQTRGAAAAASSAAPAGPPLPSCGWLVPPGVVGRVAAFDGDCLHGVLPGVGAPPGARRGEWRVTLMVALFDGLTLRPGSAPGAARPHPSAPPPAAAAAAAAATAPPPHPPSPAWAAEFLAPPPPCGAWGDASLVASLAGATPVALPRVAPLWADVDEGANAAAGVALSQLRSVPPYGECFQGF